MNTAQKRLTLKQSKAVLKPIGDLELSLRAYVGLFDGPWGDPHNLLVGELIQRTEEELAEYKKFVRRSLVEVREILDGLGLRFGMRLPEALKAKIVEVREQLDHR